MLVILPDGSRTLSYGALAEKAARLAVPETVPLKDPTDFTLIGTPAKRLDAADKVNGKAQYGIDVRLPGMKIATVAASPPPSRFCRRRPCSQTQPDRAYVN